MTQIKICGLRRIEDIEFVNKYRSDYAGFILSDGFKRSVCSETFCELERYLDKDIKRVGVFVDEPLENIFEHYAQMLDVIQLHGNEDENYIQKLRDNFNGEIWKAVRVKYPEDIEKADKLSCDKLLIDSYVKGQAGGTGKTANLDVIKSAVFTKPFLLAGGLNAENISDISENIKPLCPFGLDFSSGAETDGCKDENKIKSIIETVRSIEHGK